MHGAIQCSPAAYAENPGESAESATPEMIRRFPPRQGRVDR